MALRFALWAGRRFGGRGMLRLRQRSLSACMRHAWL